MNGLLGLPVIITSKFILKKPTVWHLIGNHYPPQLVKLIMPWASKITTEIVLVAGAMRSYYCISKKGKVIYEPVDDTFINIKPKEREFQQKKLRTSLSIPKDHFILITVGNISPAKDYECLLYAIKDVNCKLPVNLVIVGDASSNNLSYFRYIKKLVSQLQLEKCVQFLGYRSDVRELLLGSDLFVMSSLLEGTPIAILEAMACGIPIVATNVGGICEEVIDDWNGRLVSAQDSISLSKAIFSVLSSDENKKKYIINGLEMIKNRFSLVSCAEAHKQIYNEVLEY